MKCRVFPENVEKLLLDANAEDEDDNDRSNDDVLEDELTDGFLITKTKGLFISGETSHLPDPQLTSEVNCKHCLNEIFMPCLKGKVNP